MTPERHPTWSERRAYALAHNQRPDNAGEYRNSHPTHGRGRGRGFRLSVQHPTPTRAERLLAAMRSGAGNARNRPRNKRLARAARVARRVTRRGR